METGLTKIFIVDDLGSTPARVNRFSGELYLNGKTWNTLDPVHRLFVLLHEAGHVTLNTKNEIEADRFAFEAFAKLGYPLSESVKALSRVLHFDNPGHTDRLTAQIRRAFEYDKYINHNKNIDLEQMENVLNRVYESSMQGDENFSLNLKKIFVPKKIRERMDAKLAAGKAKDNATIAEASLRTAKANQAAAAIAPPHTDAPGAVKHDPGEGAGAVLEKKPIYKNPYVIGGAIIVVIILIVMMIKKQK
ncbi:MAG: hypothetical protein NTX61_08240 [Bacteroidetes bacterium]|nr:hypothetical protein [Bacteroidota bacterium]